VICLVIKNVLHRLACCTAVTRQPLQVDQGKLVVEEIAIKGVGVETTASDVTRTSGNVSWPTSDDTFKAIIPAGTRLPAYSEKIFSFVEVDKCEVAITQCDTKCAAAPSAPVHGTACGPGRASRLRGGRVPQAELFCLAFVFCHLPFGPLALVPLCPCVLPLHALELCMCCPRAAPLVSSRRPCAETAKTASPS